MPYKHNMQRKYRLKFISETSEPTFHLLSSRGQITKCPSESCANSMATWRYIGRWLLFAIYSLEYADSNEKVELKMNV